MKNLKNNQIEKIKDQEEIGVEILDELSASQVSAGQVSASNKKQAVQGYARSTR